MSVTLRFKILDALRADADGNIAKAKANIEVYLENDLPLVVKYNVASLGEIKLCLAPLPSS